MGLLEPHGRSGLALREALIRSIPVRSLAEARAALKTASPGETVVLESAEGMAAYGGPAWFKAIADIAIGEAAPEAMPKVVIDCGDDPGLVLAAIRHGFRHIRFRGPEAVAERLRDIAGQCGTVLYRDET